MTNLLLALIAIITIGLILYFLLKKSSLFKSDQEVAEEVRKKNKKYFETAHQERDHKEATHTFDKTEGVMPESHHQRNLDREVGGLEASEKREAALDDPWEERSEEIDVEGSIDQLGSTGKKSMLWRKKKAKLDLEDAMEDMSDAEQTKVQGRTLGFGAMIRDRQSNSSGQDGGLSL
jgi:hypothetical protein